MLQKQPELRTGSSDRDGHEIREHQWFSKIDWGKLERREIIPAIKPNVANELDTSNFDEEFTSQALESVVPDMAGLGGAGAAKAAASNAFEGFTFVDKGHLG